MYDIQGVLTSGGRVFSYGTVVGCSSVLACFFGCLFDVVTVAKSQGGCLFPSSQHDSWKICRWLRIYWPAF